MITRYLSRICAVMMAVLMLAACSKNDPESDPRVAFVGDYTFVSSGSIDLYAGATKALTVPVDEQGDMSIKLLDEANAVMVNVMGDSAKAYVTGNQLFLDPTEEHLTVGPVEMTAKVTFGKAPLVEGVMTIPADVDVTATYQSMNLLGKGTIEVVATKKK